MIRYRHVRSNLQTGDMLLFSGVCLVSKFLRLVTRSLYSHVGVVFRDQDLDIVYCWDSTRLGKVRDGPGIVPLSDMVRTYPGKIYLRRLRLERTPERIRILNEYRKEISGSRYERGLIELARSLLDFMPWHRNRQDLSTLFCSEHVAELYKRWGLLPQRIPSNEYTQADMGRLDIIKEGWLETAEQLIP